MNVRQLLESATARLSNSPSALPDAEILLCHALGVKRSFLYANPGQEVPSRRRGEFLRLVRSRVRGTPIAYITGRRAFWTLDLLVTPAVLIPRAETELLVETALDRLRADIPLRVADLGTGCGAIALSLAKERPRWEMHATDISSDALQVARLNASRHGLEHVVFHLGSWTRPLHGPFDLIVSNPPYVGLSDPHLQQGDLRFEPRLALSPGKDGLDAIRQIALESGAALADYGYLLVEHGHDQGRAVRSIFESGGLSGIHTIHDLAGLERACIGRKA